MLTTTYLNNFPEQIERSVDTLELISFEIGEVRFGIPMTKIARIINNLFIGEDYTLTQDVEILDLYHLLFGVEISNPNVMAIFIGDGDRLYGIPIEEVPAITAVPFNCIRTLPPDFRTSNPLGIATHVATIATDADESMMFILG
jgi:chemotaxis signal transduction protein